LKIRHKNHDKQSGNILFIILIAVALFSALSYAVTSSSGTATSNSLREQNLVTSATLIQYPAQLKIAVDRMRITKRIAPTDIEFNKPDDLSSCTSDEVCLFHPDGGAANYMQPNSDVMALWANHDWRFTSLWRVEYLGTTPPTGASAQEHADSKELTMVLVDVKPEICNKLHEKLNLSAVETSMVSDTTVNTLLNGADLDNGWTPSTAGDAIGIRVSANNFAENLEGQPAGCFISTQGTYYFYSVLVER